jgi:DNA invertase Pin-like site-specific DNA recombinase
MKRAALYARISTSNRGQDAECQLAELRDHAKRMGWDAVEYVDEGWSGRKTSRPEFDRMMEAVRRHRHDVVCVWRLDRLTRGGVRHAVEVLGQFRDLGVEFVSLRDGLSFTGPLAMALYALVAALAEAEVEALRDRTIAGLENARRKGKRLGRPPLGQASLEEILTLRDQGLPQTRIATQLGVSRAYVYRTFLGLHKTSPNLAMQTV